MKIDIEKINSNTYNSYHNPQIDESGIILSYNDGLCVAQGLYNVMIHEIVICDNGARGIVCDLQDESCYFFLLDNNVINAGMGVRRTKKLFSVKLSPKLMSRVIDVFGLCIDGFDDIDSQQYNDEQYIEKEVKGITERVSVTSPINTGFLCIDSLIPIGKGQRQLLLGNRSTGKTLVALNTIINQKKNDTLCIYVGIGQKESEIARIHNSFIESDALTNTIIISASSSKSAVIHYLAPYVGVTIAEYFVEEYKKDVIIVYDDLTNHAIAYREMSLLMKRSPSREAFPGDIFYLHARLLERAGNFISGGSITALPIAQLQEDDITAYVPTNLISITDGQLFFDGKMFNKGILPAINTELSVSRIGGAAQHPLLNKLSRGLRLDLAQYHEFASFAQFGSDLDEESENKIKKGKLLIDLLKQSTTVRYCVNDEILLLYIFKHFYKKLFSFEDTTQFIEWILSYIKHTYFEFYTCISELKQLDDETRIKFDTIISESISLFTSVENSFIIK